MEVIESKPAGLHRVCTLLPDSWLSWGIQRLLAVCSGANVVLSAVMERPCRGQDFPGEKKQRGIVETKFEVVGRHPTGDVSRASGDACLNLSVRGWKRKDVEVGLMIYILSWTPHETLTTERCLLEQLRQVTTIFFGEEVKKWAVVRVSTYFTEDILYDCYLDQNVQNQLIIVNKRQVEALFRHVWEKLIVGTNVVEYTARRFLLVLEW